MSLRTIGGKLIKAGTAIVRFTRNGKSAYQPPRRAISNSVKPLPQAPTSLQKSTDLIKENKYRVFRNLGSQIGQRARRVLIDDVLNRVGNRAGSREFQKASQRGLYGNSGPLLGLVGISVVGQGLLTKDEELEGVCWEIRECMNKIQWNRDIINQEISEENPPVNLQSFTFGKPIAKGANAVVYSVKVNNENNSGKIQEPTKFPLALKMMFNYDIQSNSLAILKAMYRETVPASVYFNRHGISNYELDFLNMTRRLPPHPNIVKMFSVFTDFVPELEKCREMYPMALPKRIDPDGEGRNMSLFILMKRYHQNLQEYLHTLNQQPSTRTSVLIFAQLLEATVHMVSHNIAHRDIKADNILLDLNDPKTPLAVISDFGCCLADQSSNLTVSYTTFDIEKGGNTALMAPEIISKRPGPFSKLNYQKSDLWAIGALGYEIFGASNPFYGNRNSRLNSLNYKDEDLPPLPHTVPLLFNRLVKNLLRRNPHQRLEPNLAANVCQLFLWAPSSWLDKTHGKMPSLQDILEWLLNLAAKLLCEGKKLAYPEYLLITTFLCRVKLQEVKLALQWIQYEDDEFNI